MLYDDRDMVECNLLAAYDRIMAFIKKHLPEQPYIEGMQRFSLRDKILREVVLNLLIHREYSSGYPATFTIYQDTVVTENWNIPYVYGSITPETVKPHRKNPNIAKVFTQMGIVEELGSGTRKIFEYTPIYSNGKQAQIEEEDVYRVTIPFQPTHLGSRSETINETINETGNIILSIIKGNPHVTQEELMKATAKSRATITRVLKQLQANGIIVRMGAKKNGKWMVID